MYQERHFLPAASLLEWPEGIERATIFDSGEVCMAARQVILYFDDQKDALRFALAAGSVMAGEGQMVTTEERTLIQETQRASRILLDEPVNTGTPAEPAR
jgi:hypothetical protein